MHPYLSSSLSQHSLRAEFDYTSPIGQYELTLNYNRNPSGGKTESANAHAVKSHDPGAIEQCSVPEGSITLNDGSQYRTAVESQDEGTVRGENVTSTDLVSGSSATSNAQHSAIPQGIFNLIEAALMVYDRYLNVNRSMDEIRGLTYSYALLRAAREMGSELPCMCFEAESQSLSDWVEAQRRIRAHAL